MDVIAGRMVSVKVLHVMHWLAVNGMVVCEGVTDLCHHSDRPRLHGRAAHDPGRRDAHLHLSLSSDGAKPSVGHLRPTRIVVAVG